MSTVWKKWNKKFVSYFKRYKKSYKIVQELHKIVAKINALEPSIQILSNELLQHKTQEFKERLQAGASLDTLLCEAFAVIREASVRTLGMRHFDAQLLGGIALHKGMIAEMKTGEGKTLASTAPVYLNALMGIGVHIVTVNDYLANRDAVMLRPLYNFLGLSVGCVTSDIPSYEKRQAYGCDITYGTNNEFGFDFLRDNMKTRLEDQVQRGHHFAIVDEVDSILIDEARTPLIISGPAEDSSQLYQTIDRIVSELLPEHYEKDEKQKNISFTEQGWEVVEEKIKEQNITKDTTLFDAQNTMLVHHLNQALKARFMFEKNIDYIVHNGKVIIIDEFTGRMKKGSRYSDGLHQALEAKEGVEIEPENQTLASVTFQNYFLMYTKLAGMTGTAVTEAAEFQETYSLPVVEIPTHRKVLRQDLDDEVFATFPGKIKAVVRLVEECRAKRQPVLVGTSSIEKSEIFSKAFEDEGIPHYVLNARHHEQEAIIIARAGLPGAVTIATNMAGRGTDIQLGGSVSNELALRLKDIEDSESRARIETEVRAEIEVQKQIAIQAGGLYIVGTERHESRRIDNQLRGRSGRQGDPGTSKFFISLEDDLMRVFGSNIEFVKRSFLKDNQDDSIPVTHPWLTRNIEKAQGRVEAQHFERRKQLLKYAQVLNEHRKEVYKTRNNLLRGKALDVFQDIQEALVYTLVSYYTNSKKLPDFWELSNLTNAIKRVFQIDIDFECWIAQEVLSPEILEERILVSIQEAYQRYVETLDEMLVQNMIQTILLQTLDQEWTKHLNVMSHLREGIHLRSYGQKDPLNEYKKEAFTLFKYMILGWQEQSLTQFYNVDPLKLLEQWHSLYDDETEPVEEIESKKIEYDAPLSVAPPSLLEFTNNQEKPYVSPRNAPCPCGSGKRYKQCHGSILS
ncbi:preprotein translocase subunit SecA [Holospora curviuscula]|uniref:Protein translocase subunit SecA n=1 Tax=Holospora curviuscula TaxID=1082868 RepID=A0A2S5R7I8_9PROT|nr:preprotein translocase subunit SecA [Holospora curviuscula]PPE03306.1 preprotein translocase subunit SecA [Holospora curviuscula]